MRASAALWCDSGVSGAPVVAAGAGRSGCAGVRRLRLKRRSLDARGAQDRARDGRFHRDADRRDVVARHPGDQLQQRALEQHLGGLDRQQRAQRALRRLFPRHAQDDPVRLAPAQRHPHAVARPQVGLQLGWDAVLEGVRQRHGERDLRNDRDRNHDKQLRTGGRYPAAAALCEPAAAIPQDPRRSRCRCRDALPGAEYRGAPARPVLGMRPAR